MLNQVQHGVARAEATKAELRLPKELILALLLTAAAYVPALWAYFQEDDWGHLLRVANGHDPWAFGPWFYRPLFLVAFRAMYNAFGLQAPLWHAATISLHLANVALIYWLVRRMGLRSTPAAIGAALFGVYPAGTGAVAWLCACSGVMSAFFGLAAAHIAITRRIPAIVRGVLCASVWMLGVLAKEDAASLVFVLPFLPLFVEGKRTRGEMVRWFVSCAAFAVGLVVFQRLESSCHQIHGNATASISLGMVRRAAMFTAFAMQGALPLTMTSTLWSAVLTAAAPAMVWIRSRDLRLGMLWFFGSAMGIGLAIGCLAPVDRYYYIPNIGVAIFVAALMQRLSAWRIGPGLGRWALIASCLFALSAKPGAWFGWGVAAVLAFWFWVDSTPTSKDRQSCAWMIGASLALRAMEWVFPLVGWGCVPEWGFVLAPVAMAGILALGRSGRAGWVDMALCGCVVFWLGARCYSVLLSGMLAIEVFRSHFVTSTKLPESVSDALHSLRARRVAVLSALVLATCAWYAFSQNLEWRQDGMRLESMARAGAALMKPLPRGAHLTIVDGAGVGTPEPRAHNVIAELMARRPDLRLEIVVPERGSRTQPGSRPKPTYRGPVIEYSPDGASFPTE